MKVMKLAALTLLASALGFAAGTSGCGRSDVNASPLGAGGTPGEEKKPDKVLGLTDKGDEWKAEVTVKKPKATDKDKSWTMEVVLTSSGNWHVNDAYPYGFAATKVQDVKLEKEKYPKDDPAWKLDKCEVVKDKEGKEVKECKELHFLAKLLVDKPETAELTGSLKFGVCSGVDGKCKFDSAKFKVALATIKNS